MDRFWEAHDFIIKAMTQPRRAVQLGGRVLPLSPGEHLAAPGAAAASAGLEHHRQQAQARLLGEKGYVMATLGSGYDTRPLYDAYREGYLAKWKKPAPADRFAYLGLVAVADNEAEARRRGELVAGYLRSSAIVYAPFRNPPGFLSVDDNARMLRGQSAPRSFTKDGRAVDMHTAACRI